MKNSIAMGMMIAPSFDNLLRDLIFGLDLLVG